MGNILKNSQKEEKNGLKNLNEILSKNITVQRRIPIRDENYNKLKNIDEKTQAEVQVINNNELLNKIVLLNIKTQGKLNFIQPLNILEKYNDCFKNKTPLDFKDIYFEIKKINFWDKKHKKYSSVDYKDKHHNFVLYTAFFIFENYNINNYEISSNYKTQFEPSEIKNGIIEREITYTQINNKTTIIDRRIKQFDFNFMYNLFKVSIFEKINENLYSSNFLNEDIIKSMYDNKISIAIFYNENDYKLFNTFNNSNHFDDENNDLIDIDCVYLTNKKEILLKDLIENYYFNETLFIYQIWDLLSNEGNIHYTENRSYLNKYLNSRREGKKI